MSPDPYFRRAALWTSAWTEGNGNAIPDAAIIACDTGDLDELHRHDAEFVPSMSLADMVDSAHFEP